MSFVAAYRVSSGQSIYLIFAKTKLGRACYFYLMAPAHKVKQLKESGDADLSTLGQILLSGFGPFPSPKHQEQMFATYGFPKQLCA